MPSRLAVRSPQHRAQRRQQSEQAQPVETIRGESPWFGYVPDLDPSKLGLNACGNVQNLIAKPALDASGEILTHSDGTTLVDEDRLPGVVGAVAPVDGNSELSVTGLGFFPRTDAAGERTSVTDFTTMMVTGGDNNPVNAGSCQLWRVSPLDGQWDVVAFDNAGTEAVGGLPEAGGADRVLVDWAVFPAGSPNRTLGAIGEPCFVFTNNADEVYVYPNATAGTSYEALTAFGTVFKARSVASFGGRMNFLNTLESSVRHRQRLRRAHIGEADPNTSIGSGAGALDFREFAEDGLKLLPFRNRLGVYFGDGAALVSATGNPAAPYSKEALTTKRGILGTHAVAAIDGNTHFCICTDGWWVLDSSGRWSEAGIAEIDGIQVTKWKTTFYDQLDMNHLERLFVHYDQANRLVHITFPIEGAAGADPNTVVWIYDPRGDRVWIDTYHATVFASPNLQIQTSTTIGDLTGQTIGDLAGQTIGSFSAKFGTKSTIHGTYNGLVMLHDPDLTSRIDINTLTAVEPSYLYRTVLSSTGNPLLMKRIRNIYGEMTRISGTGDPTFTAFCSVTAGQESGSVPVSAIATGGTDTLWRRFHFTSPQLGMEVSGQGPVQWRSFGVSVQNTGAEIHRS